jgi:hypothetical protein
MVAVRRFSEKAWRKVKLELMLALTTALQSSPSHDSPSMSSWGPPLVQFVSDAVAPELQPGFRVRPRPELGAQRESPQAEIITVDQQVGASSQGLVIPFAEDASLGRRVARVKGEEAARAFLQPDGEDDVGQVEYRDPLDPENGAPHPGGLVHPDVGPGRREAPLGVLLQACGRPPLLDPVGVRPGLEDPAARDHEFPVGEPGGVVKSPGLGRKIEFGARAGEPLPVPVLAETGIAGDETLAGGFVVDRLLPGHDDIAEGDADAPGRPVERLRLFLGVGDEDHRAVAVADFGPHPSRGILRRDLSRRGRSEGCAEHRRQEGPTPSAGVSCSEPSSHSVSSRESRRPARRAPIYAILNLSQ